MVPILHYHIIGWFRLGMLPILHYHIIGWFRYGFPYFTTI